MRKLICSLFCLLTTMIVQGQIVLERGTLVPLKVTKKIGLSNANTGQVLELEVSIDISVDGTVVIPRGSKAKGIITNVVRSSKVDNVDNRFWGRGSESFTYHLTSVFLPDGRQVALKNDDVIVKGLNLKSDVLGKQRAVLRKDAEVIGTVAEEVSLYSGQKTANSITVVENSVARKATSPTVKSDVDQNIPVSKGLEENTFAVIIANENYASEVAVDFALNDGRTFKEYCQKTLGLPEENIHYVEDATKNVIEREIDWISKVANAFGSDAKVIIYYAGHGIPDDKTGASYLLPVDGTGSNYKTGFSTADMYKQLSALPASNITVMMDACFSGTKRGEGMLTAARGVAIKSKMEAPKGNLVIMTAAQGDETAHPYPEKGHGMFTYFLLKKLQDSKGSCTLSELGDYVKTQVTRRSIIVNGKQQTPCVSASTALGDAWKSLKLK